MAMNSGRLICSCLILLLASTSLQAAGTPLQPLLIAQNGHTGNGGISLDQAVAQTRQRYNGKVLSADTVRIDGRKVYRIKILTKDGRVKRTQIDARSGRTESRGH